ncbi:MAG: dihydroorotate dehydrogenase electron transfer subunit [Candidatus Geothermincolia bacterium]
MNARIAQVVNVEHYGKGVMLRLLVPGAPIAQPGQFAHILCDHGTERVLRRPYSILGQDDDVISIFVRVSGLGSAWLAARAPGDTVDLMLPLGTGWRLADGGSLLVAGGSGIAPLAFLAERLAPFAGPVELLWGLDCFEDYGNLPTEIARRVPLSLATCDGSSGVEGTALDLMTAKLRQREWKTVYACGPHGMLAGVAKSAASHGISCQVSLEERMACGIGACLGCSVASAKREDGNLRVCADGPVFDAADMRWGEEE